jgi:hypothetical protein
MSTLTEVIKLVPFDAPINTVVASILVTATEAGGATSSASITSLTPDANGTLTAPPILLSPGTWTVKAQALDVAGSPIGPAAFDPTPYTVSAPTTVSVEIPGSLSGTVA